ncbi:MAG: DUF6173 family protein [Steroidobacteraceae bacterium]
MDKPPRATLPESVIQSQKMMDSIYGHQEEIARQGHLQRNPVIEVCDAIKQYVEEFERGLDNEHEIAVRLASFGGEVTFHAEQIGFSKPNVITFYGKTDQGENVQLIQHVSQLSFLLKAAKKLAPKPNRIGFV